MNLQLLKDFLATLDYISELSSNSFVYRITDQLPYSSENLFEIEDKKEELKKLIEIEEEKIVKERFNFLVNQRESIKSEMCTTFLELAKKRTNKVSDIIRGKVKITKDWGEILTIDLSQNDAIFEILNHGGENVSISIDDLGEEDLITLIDFMIN